MSDNAGARVNNGTNREQYQQESKRHRECIGLVFNSSDTPAGKSPASSGAVCDTKIILNPLDSNDWLVYRLIMMIVQPGLLSRKCD